MSEGMVPREEMLFRLYQIWPRMKLPPLKAELLATTVMTRVHGSRGGD